MFEKLLPKQNTKYIMKFYFFKKEHREIKNIIFWNQYQQNLIEFKVNKFLNFIKSETNKTKRLS